MGILRADVLTHSQLEPSGSVLFDGNSDYLSWSNTNVKVGTSDFTLEAWVNITGNNDATQHQTIFMAGDSSDAGELVLQMIRDTGGGGSALGSGADREIGIRVAGTGYYSGQQITFNQWHHVAVVRDGGAITFFLDGEAGKTHTMTENLTTGFTQIGYRDGSYNGYFKGYISNARIALGAIYKNNFTPSKFELKNVAGTLLLCCQSSTSATTAEVVPSAITANGTAAAASFHPDLKKDITDTGVVFDGFTVLATSTYMVPPSGKTTERNRGRGLIMGGGTPSGASTGIESIEVQSSGNGVDFGSLSATTRYNGGAASATRGLSIGGKSPSVNTIEFVTIANSSNSTDFGDLTQDRRYPSPVSNDTRAVIMGGYAEAPVGYNNIIDFVTIATAGNATDFGDTTNTVTNGAPVNSTTRGLMCGGQGNDPYARENVIQFITIASTGNAQDFGDLTLERRGMSSVSSSTRGIISGGAASPAATNIMDYVTIASAGDAIDFGDSTVAVAFKPTGQICSRTRGVFVAGGYPSQGNVIDFVTIATTGNASDFGDLLVSITDTAGACSDSHGGL